MPTLTFRDSLAAYFRDRPGQWVDGTVLAQIAGCYAWRSRCSDLRTQLGMQIGRQLDMRLGVRLGMRLKV